MFSCWSSFEEISHCCDVTDMGVIVYSNRRWWSESEKLRWKFIASDASDEKMISKCQGKLSIVSSKDFDDVWVDFVSKKFKCQKMLKMWKALQTRGKFICRIFIEILKLRNQKPEYSTSLNFSRIFCFCFSLDVGVWIN